MNSTFKPTEEQLFEFYLEKLDSRTTQLIQDYLNENPHEEQRLKEYDLFINKYESMPLTEPSNEVLQRVRENAQKHAKQGFLSKLFNFNVLVYRRQLGWALMVFVVVGLSYALKEVRKTDPVGLVNETKVAATDNQKLLVGESSSGQSNGGNETASFTGGLTREATEAMTIGAAGSESLQNYIKGLSLFHKSEFKSATDIFAAVIAENPKFEKRVQLYTFWIKALEKMGDSESVDEKREELKKIEEEIASQNL